MKQEITTCTNVCSTTVAHNLCIGCGVCASVCPVQNLTMRETLAGQWEPAEAGRCLNHCSSCIDTCPFVNHEDNESSLSKRQFGHIKGIRHAPETGFYLSTYVGHAGDDYRNRGASGGIASWLLISLLEANAVDHVICVRPKADPQCLFEYAILSNADDIRAASRSAYYPVELSNVLQCVAQKDGRYAIVALPCVAKALRLAGAKHPKLGSRLTYILGLVCGQTKSRCFTEYCAAVAGGIPENLLVIEYRKKFKEDLSKAGYECTFRDSQRLVRKQVLGWEHGMGKTWANCAFTPRACLFCDDVFAETADCALMDAWLPEYSGEWLGTSMILVRAPSLDNILSNGVADGTLTLSAIPLSRITESQVLVLRNKREDIWLRIRHEKRKGRPVPEKRHQLLSPPSWLRRPRVIARMRIQSISHELWHSRKGLAEFLDELTRIELWPSRIEQLAALWNRLRHIMKSRLSNRVTSTDLNNKI